MAELARGLDRMRIRLAQPRPGAPGVHRQRLARAQDAAVRARRLSRAAGGRGSRRGDATGLPRDRARAGRPPDEARNRSARPLEARCDKRDFGSEPVDLVATGARRGVRPARRGDGHELSVADSAVRVGLGDADASLRIGRSLVENALRHTPAGTSVELRASIWVDRAQLSVHDDGPGIAPAIRSGSSSASTVARARPRGQRHRARDREGACAAHGWRDRAALGGRARRHSRSR